MEHCTYKNFGSLLPSQKNALMRMPLSPKQMCESFGSFTSFIDDCDVSANLSKAYVECGADTVETASQLTAQFFSNLYDWYEGGSMDALMLCLDDLTRVDDSDKWGNVLQQVNAVIH